MMKNNKTLAATVVLVLALSLSGSVFAKNDNGNGGGNSGQSHGNSGNSNAGGNSDHSGGPTVTVGEVEDVQGNKIKVEDKKGQKEDAEVGKTTEVVHQNKGKGKGSPQIKKNDKVAILSEDEEEGTEGGKVKKALKVFVKDASASAQSKRRAIQGVVTGISGSTITIAHQIHRDQVTTVLTDGSTMFKIKGVTEASMSAIQVGQRIIAMGEATDGGLLATRIHVIPGLAKGIFKKNPVASGSAQPSASASALPTSEPSASASAEPTP